MDRSRRYIKIGWIVAGLCLGIFWLSVRRADVYRMAAAFTGLDQFKVSVCTGDSSKDILPWDMKDGRICFFLPAYADLSQCCFVYDDKICSLFLEDKSLAAGEMLDGYAFDVPYTLSLADSAAVECVSVTFFRSENLPAVFIDTESGALDFVHADKGNREPAETEIVDALGQISYQGGGDLKSRGNETWQYDKKPYLLTLSEEAPLLGMDSGRKGVLLANYLDHSYIRNSLAYGLAESVGMAYTSGLRYVDLYLNGQYRGCYQLAEKIEIGKGRVDIHNLEGDNDRWNRDGYKENRRFGVGAGALKGIDGMNNPPDITGGYLIERNYGGKYADKISGFITDNGEKFVVRSPSCASKEEVEYIRSLTQHAENGILAPDGIDLASGRPYTDFIDEDSFVKKYLLEEIVLNEAQGATSAWFYKPEDAVDTKLYAGPAWDYDKAMGNTELSYGCFMNPEVLSKLSCYYTENSEWYYHLYAKESFRANVRMQYATLFLPQLEKILSEEMGRYAAQIRGSVKMDKIRWENTDDFDECVDDLREWMRRRVGFLNEIWIEGREDIYLVRLEKRPSDVRWFNSVWAGERLEEEPYLKIEGYEFLYWYDAEHDKKYMRGEIPVITEDILLTGVYEKLEE